jgi:hypothetical protein
LLLEQLQQGHSTFLLHTGSSLDNLFTRLERPKFCALLERFWAKFALTWDVMLHGSPASDIYGGMKLAAGGELGMGVGEEEWGSGEREVLEEFVRRTDGLVDMVVSRFGHPPPVELSKEKDASAKPTKPQLPEPWMGVGRLPQASDGVVFSGMGMISRSSLSDISQWLCTLYGQGEAAFGVRESPTSDRRRRKRPARKERKENLPLPKESPKMSIPPSIVQSAEKSLDQATSRIESKQAGADQSKPKTTRTKSSSKPPTVEATDAAIESSSWTKYLKLGYGTAWSLPEFDTSEIFSSGASAEALTKSIPEDALKARIEAHVVQENGGYFLVGLRGDPDDESDEVAAQAEQNDSVGDWNRRLMLRALHVYLTPLATTSLDPSSGAAMALLSPALSTPGIDTDAAARALSLSSSTQAKRRRLRAVVYAHRPFIYVLLFNPSAPSLMIPSFYQHLHTFLSPLRDLLNRSTGSVIGGMRRKGSLFGIPTTPGDSKQTDLDIEKAIYEVLYDEGSLTTISSVPNIPRPLSLSGPGDAEVSYPKSDADCPPGWTRAEALNVHCAILDILASNRLSSSDDPSSNLAGGAIERSVKTSRGWWVVWGQLRNALGTADSAHDITPTKATSSGWLHTLNKQSAADAASQDYFSQQHSASTESHAQVILIRRAQNVDSKGKARVTSGLGWNLSLGGAASEAGKMLDASRFGIGFDARKYMEGIVRLGR